MNHSRIRVVLIPILAVSAIASASIFNLSLSESIPEKVQELNPASIAVKPSIALEKQCELGRGGSSRRDCSVSLETS